MGLFDFFKRKYTTSTKSQPEKPPIKANEQGEFNLQLSDFSEKIHRAEVLKDAWISPEFEKLVTGTPMKKGDKIELKTYIARVILWEQPVEATFDPGTATENTASFVQKINHQLNWLLKSRDLINEMIIRDLLPLKNDNWLDENEQPLTREDFLKPIQLASIGFIRNAAFNLYYDDGDLFGGHSIEVKISAKREVKKASIVG